jgi:predicted small metal-binding protein
MTKKLHCKDLGFDCAGIVEGETETEVLEKVAAHAQEAHNLTEMSDEVVEKVRSVMQ